MRGGSWIVVVIQCFSVDFLVEGCGSQRCGPPGGVYLRGADLPEVWTSLLILHTLIVASAQLHA
jgi:hypothetical protein